MKIPGAWFNAARTLGIGLDEYAARRRDGERWCTFHRTWHPKQDMAGGKKPSMCAEGLRLYHRQRYKPTGRSIGRPPAPTREGDRRQARRRVNYMVERGDIPKASERRCVDCGHQAEEYDHHNGYDADHHLEVEPVCKPCHVERERQRDIAEAEASREETPF